MNQQGQLCNNTTEILKYLQGNMTSVAIANACNEIYNFLAPYYQCETKIYSSFPTTAGIASGWAMLVVQLVSLQLDLVVSITTPTSALSMM